MAVRYTTIDRILDDVARHKMLRNLTVDDVVYYVAKFLQIAGVPQTLENKVAKIDVKDYKAAIPCDFHSLIQIRDLRTGNCILPSTNNFNLSPIPAIGENESYQIQGGAIILSKREAPLEMSYRAIKVDCKGLPMVPDDEFFMDAVVLYIKKEVFQDLYDEGKLQYNQMNETKIDYAKSINRMRSFYNTPDLGEMDIIANMNTQLLPESNPFRNGFRNLSDREYIIRH